MNEVILYLRLLAYTALALLFLLVLPVYYREAVLRLRTLGLFFLAGGVSLLLRLYAGADAYLWWGNYVLTPLTFGLVVVTLIDLAQVSAWRGSKHK